MPDGNLDICIDRPVSPSQIVANVKHALSLGLPEVPQVEPRGEMLYIYANGPSAKAAPLKGVSIALNGAIKLFYDRNCMPMWWAASDPRESVAGHLSEGGVTGRGCLVASRCDRAVFDRLLSHVDKRNVYLWHLNDESESVVPASSHIMPDAPSVTLSTLFLAHLMGYRNVTVYGWDCCFGPDGESHAVPQAQDNEMVEAEFNGRTFLTTLQWLAEAQDAVQMLNMLPDINLTIDGSGMLSTMLQPLLDHRAATQNQGARDAYPQERQA